MRTTRILVAVTDLEVEAEARRALAATGMQAVCTTDPRAIVAELRQVALALVDERTAPHVAAERSCGQAPVGLVLLSSPGEDIDWKFAVKIGAIDALCVPDQTEDLITLLAGVREPLPGPAVAGTARIIAITSPVGGAGCSTLAVACARQLCQEGIGAVLLVDADVASGGLDLLAGMENLPGPRWEDLPPTGLEAGHLAQLPTNDEDLSLLTWTRSNTPGVLDVAGSLDAERLTEVLTLAADTHTVVVDVPGHAPWFPAVDHLADTCIVVLPPEARAVASCQRFLLGIGASVQVVTHPRGWSGLSDEEVGEILGLDVACHWPFDRKVGKTAELTGLVGPLPRSLRTVARKVVADHVAA